MASFQNMLDSYFLKVVSRFLLEFSLPIIGIDIAIVNKAEYPFSVADYPLSLGHL